VLTVSVLALASATPAVPGSARPATVGSSARLAPDALAVSLHLEHNLVDAYSAVLFNATAAGGTPPYTYSWNGLPWGCRSANTPGLSCTPIVAGTYNVSVTVTDAAASTVTSASQVVTVNQRLLVTLKTNYGTGPTVSGPASLKVEFDALYTGGTAPILTTWIFGDGTIATSHYRVHVYTTPGTYLAHLWVNDSAGVDVEKNLTVSVGAAGHSGGTTFALFGLKGNVALLALGIIVAAVIAVAVVVPWRIHQARTSRLGVRPLQPAPPVDSGASQGPGVEKYG
jgi:PKD repeat protein